MQGKANSSGIDRLTRKRYGRTIVALRRLTLIILWIGGAGAVALGVYTIFFSNIFAIQSIEIRSSRTLNIEALRSALYRQLDEKTFTIFPQKNIFLFNTYKASNTIASMVRIQKLSIRKSYPHTIYIDLDGKEFQILWYANGNIQRIGPQGTVIGEADQAMIAALPLSLLQARYGAHVPRVDSPINKNASIPTLVVSAQNDTENTEHILIKKDDLERLYLLKEQCKNSGFDMAFVVYDRSYSTATIVSSEGWDVFVTIDPSIERQLQSVATLLSHSIGQQRQRLRSIDVRFGNRAYYTFR